MNTLIVGAAWSSLLGATGVLVKSFEDVVEVHRDAPCNILFVYPKAWQGPAPGYHLEARLQVEERR